MKDWQPILQEEDERRRRRAWVVSSLVYGLIAVGCVFITAFTLEIPPPGEQFVAVGMADFGQSQEAGGERETEVPSEVVEEVVAEQESAAEAPEVAEVENVATQEESEIELPVQEETPVDPEPIEDPDPEVSSQLANAFGAFTQSGGGGTQGENDGTGNEGVDDGKVEGRGVVTGDFGESLLEGGQMIGDPNLDELPEQEGVVRMIITVNKAGQVTDSRYDPLNSTTSDSRLIALARRAAATARFTTHPTKFARQGWIQFNFELE
jgi:outer membrane biosynthesis protein TonB